jgi:hypothetical protein
MHWWFRAVLHGRWALGLPAPIDALDERAHRLELDDDERRLAAQQRIGFGFFLVILVGNERTGNEISFPA